MDDDRYTEAMGQVTRLGREVEELRAKIWHLETEINDAKRDAEYYTDRAVRDVAGQLDSHERSHR